MNQPSAIFQKEDNVREAICEAAPDSAKESSVICKVMEEIEKQPSLWINEMVRCIRDVL